MAATGTYVTALAWETVGTEKLTRVEYAANQTAIDTHDHNATTTGKGVRAVQTTSAPSVAGQVQITGDVLKIYGTGVHTLLDLDQVQTVSVSKKFDTGQDFKQIATPANPSAGYDRIYAKSDDQLYRLTSTGAETPIGFVPGAIVAYGAGTTDPAGWLLCDGRAVSRTTYAALFTAISTTYGVGDGATTFNIPDLRSRYPMGADNMGTAAGAASRASGSVALGNTSGADTKALASGENGNHSHSHTHTDAGHTHPITGDTTGASTNTVLTQGSGGANSKVTGSGTASLSTDATTSGSGTAFSLRNLNQICNWIVKT